MVHVAVIQFPGSNADWDALHAARNVLGFRARMVFHQETSLDGFDAAIVPGGFSYGDYLRPGAIACFSPIVDALRGFVRRGGFVLGICNGFQILTELGLLPGALTRNAHLRFECRDVHVRVDANGPFTSRGLGLKEVLRLPIAHADGRYHCSKEVLDRLEGDARVAFRYCTETGAPPRDEPQAGLPVNPNGSISDIAGVYNAERNVLGMMPHPERASEAILGNADGRRIFESLRTFLLERS